MAKKTEREKPKYFQHPAEETQTEKKSSIDDTSDDILN